MVWGLADSRYVITGERISLLPGEESTTDWYVDRRRLGGVLRNLVGASTWMEGSWLFGSYSGRDLSGFAGSRIPGTRFFINHKNLPFELFREKLHPSFRSSRTTILFFFFDSFSITSSINMNESIEWKLRNTLKKKSIGILMRFKNKEFLKILSRSSPLARHSIYPCWLFYSCTGGYFKRRGSGSEGGREPLCSQLVKEEASLDTSQKGSASLPHDSE